MTIFEMTLTKLWALFCRLLRLGYLFTSLTTLFFSISCGRRDTSLISKRIVDYAIENCRPALRCEIPESIYFYQGDFDRITIMEEIHQVSSIRKAAGISTGNIDDYGSTEALKGHRIWVLSKGNAFFRLFTEVELYHSDIAYPLLIDWPENNRIVDEPPFLRIDKGVTNVYATLKPDRQGIMRPAIITK